jgi:bifunctional UDP-N-acetylglucosamine pyrophosphorylase/glucosamine-1-phosphate N-acetyltransferase
MVIICNKKIQTSLDPAGIMQDKLNVIESLKVLNKTMLNVVILAAGEGKRFRSATPKIMHPLWGKPIIDYVIDAATLFDTQHTTLVVSPKIKSAFKDDSPFTLVEQDVPRGTGDALKIALHAIENHHNANDNDDILILCGDTPLITKETLHTFYKEYKKQTLTSLMVGSFVTNTPSHYGRCVIEDGKIQRIVETKDANIYEASITTCNAGIYLGPLSFFKEHINHLSCHNAQGEFYLTDIMSHAHNKNIPVFPFFMNEEETQGINTRSDFSHAAHLLQKRWIQKHQDQGVTFLDPSTTLVWHDTILGEDSVIHPHVVIGKGVTVHSHATVHAFTYLEDSILKKHTSVGPFARLRGGCVLEERAEIGNFVEAKKTHMHEGAKAKHLAYLGDATLGTYANIGAGVITCNYDGQLKHKTFIGDEAFIGSNTALIAPISIGKNAIVGAGSTLQEDVPDEALCFTRSPQIIKRCWATKHNKRVKN